jgi:hypothetical protein
MVEAGPMRTHKKGERVHIYASLKRIEPDEEARIAAEFGIDVDAFPRGVLVGTVEIVGCEPLAPEHSRVACFGISESTGGFAWLLKNARRGDVLIKPEGHPQPSFFEPF